ncbi:dihydrofolate reductase family protein [Aquincola sp. MAHUQ-54]|uniref:Dihydrofolate reductase family protein n=1 Tax=Aquincola agrisoli TaxID=3119538 RepID=A0AAW9QK91_9BURK
MNADEPTTNRPAWAEIWAAALEIARCRRAGRAAPPSVGALRRTEAGWAAQAALAPGDAALFALYKPLLDRGADAAPWLVGQLGQSLDGCIATACGDSHFVTGEENLLHLHRLRALCDAVLVGAGTAAADDPQLTTRRVDGPHPVRVLIDPAARLSPRLRALSDGQAPTLWLHDASAAGPGTPLPPGTAMLAVPGLAGADGRLHGAALVAALAARGLKLLFVEGGGVTVSRLLAQGCLDRLHVAVAPVIIGAGRRGLALPSFERMRDCLRPKARTVPMGDDLLWDLDLRG